jgi:hypothetical protein
MPAETERDRLRALVYGREGEATPADIERLRSLEAKERPAVFEREEPAPSAPHRGWITAAIALGAAVIAFGAGYALASPWPSSDAGEPAATVAELPELLTVQTDEDRLQPAEDDRAPLDGVEQESTRFIAQIDLRRIYLARSSRDGGLCIVLTRAPGGAVENTACSGGGAADAPTGMSAVFGEGLSVIVGDVDHGIAGDPVRVSDSVRVVLP